MSFIDPWFATSWFGNEWFPDFTVVETMFFGGGPDRSDTTAGPPPAKARTHKLFDVELEEDLELWFEDRKKYGRVYLELPPVVLEPEVLEEVRPVFIPYEPPPVRDDTAERLALAAQRAQEAVSRLIERSNEGARQAVAAAIARIEETETMKVVAAAMVAMENEE
jgi:hypothetical protein